jgi:protein-tyrosine phosphatase
MMNEKEPLRVLFVCHGNICRSPAAEGAFKHLIRERGLQSRFIVDSAGTSSFHVGERPHPDTRRAAREMGIELDSLARQFRVEDFDRFDWIFAMDHNNLSDLLSMARNDADRKKVMLFRTFDPQRESDPVPDVPDPYYGGYSGFREVQQIVMRTAEKLLDFLLSGRTTV